jgi:hypothetical protein
MSIFGSEKIIEERVIENNFRAYLIGFDIDDNSQNVYRIDPFVDILLNTIPEFAFGFHEGKETENSKLLEKLKEAAKSIYKIEVFEEVSKLYLEDKYLDDDIPEKYLKRGEFGELILHLFLRDRFNTIPLLSKIYFKDSRGIAVHGFDAIHIDESNKILWLGESKIYTIGKNGINSLVDDLSSHLKVSFLKDEFAIVSKRLNSDNADYLKDKNHWLSILDSKTKLSDVLDSTNLVLICTYTSNLFKIYTDEGDSNFCSDYLQEVNDLKDLFNSLNNTPLKDDVNIILLLLPIQDKNELIKKLHTKLKIMQSL